MDELPLFNLFHLMQGGSHGTTVCLQLLIKNFVSGLLHNYTSIQAIMQLIMS